LPNRDQKSSAAALSSKAKSFVSKDPLKKEACNPNTNLERLVEMVRCDPSLVLEMAQNPGFSKRHLQAIEEFLEDTHLSLLAKNPHLSTECLLELAETHPSEVLDNPALPLLLLEDPSFLQKAPGSLLIELLKRPNPPRELFQQVAHSENRYIYPELVQHPDLPAEILEDLAWSADTPFVLLHAFLHPNLPRETALLIARAEECPNNGPYAFSPDELRKLSISSKKWHREITARHPKTPIDCLALLATDVHSWVRILVAGNPATPVDILELLTRAEPDLIIYWSKKTGAPASLVERLLDEGVIKPVVAASSPALSAKTISTLSIDPKLHDPLSRNPSLPPPLAEKIYRSNRESRPLDRYGNPYLRLLENLAENEACPLHLLEEMATDEEPSLRCHAAKNPNLPLPLLESLTNDPEARVRSYAALNPKLTREQLSRLCSDPEERVRCEAAQHPALDEEQLLVLMHDPSREIRGEVMRHGLSVVLVQKLAQDPDSWIREFAQLSLARRALLTELVQR
jgi:hypothetical protein